MTAGAAPVVVLLTGPGRAAVASLLVAGDAATDVVAALFHPAGRRSLAHQPRGRIVYGRWQSAETGEEVVVCRRAPQRVEIHCHGGQASARAITASLVERGCREISWQQWTRQSAPDPVAADAEIALAAAATERTALVLWDQQAGALAGAVRAARELIAAGQTAQAVGSLEALLEWWPLGRHLVEPWRVVLAGQPNVGKSSLVNALVGYQRAIVHPTPGTTRDAVTAAAAFDGWPVELSDTAGLREGGQKLESAGIELARERLRTADLVVLVFDGSRPWSSEDEALAAEWPAALRVVNKCDLPAAAGHELAGAVRTSAVQGEGIDELARAIARRLLPGDPADGQPMPFLAWQAAALSAALKALSGGQTAEARRELAKFEPC